MRPSDRLRNEFVVLRQLLRGMPQGAAHSQRLEAFYGPQAEQYDEFRDRLLPGRAELIERLPLVEGARVVELGAGTGRNLDFLGERIDQLQCVELVDLCSSLLAVARRRAQGNSNIRIVVADASNYRPAEKVDCVYLSYSLTMIPKWREAIDNASSILKPGGVIGVVDFCVPIDSASKFRFVNAAEKSFWKRWFAHDGVRLDPEHRNLLQKRFPKHEIVERRARIPYLPAALVPYYLFIGRKSPDS